MTLISDILLAAGAMGAMIYCFVLSRRLTKFNDLEKGMGGAIAVLSVQVDDMTRALVKAQRSAGESREDLVELNARSETAAQRLELLMASLHDLPEKTPQRPSKAVETAPDVPAWRTRRTIKGAVG